MLTFHFKLGASDDRIDRCAEFKSTLPQVTTV